MPVGGVLLPADVAIPAGARGLVVFAHGSGSSRKSARNQFVAGSLRERGLGTLLFDLLTAAEERRDAIDAQLRFDIPFLASRLRDVTDWAKQHETTKNLVVGYFGASTGAAAALMAAAELPELAAVVSRGGRPDLAADALTQVRAPTLLIVGGEDASVLNLNRAAFEQLTGLKKLRIVAGATHLFEEPRALEQVAALAGDWLVKYLGAS
ncbi:MAG: alpha/beta family hydrolase [Deltaproteobacteria bacterium]